MEKSRCASCGHTDKAHDNFGCRHTTILKELRCPVDDAAGWAWSRRHRELYSHGLTHTVETYGASPQIGCPCQTFTTDPAAQKTSTPNAQESYLEIYRAQGLC